MQTQTVEEYIPYQVLVPSIEPEDDLTLAFLLKIIPTKEIEDCVNLSTISCKTERIAEDDFNEAFLYWNSCGIETVIEVEENGVIVEDGEITVLKFYIDQEYLSNVNLFKMIVTVKNVSKIIAKGKVYLNL